MTQFWALIPVCIVTGVYYVLKIYYRPKEKPAEGKQAKPKDLELIPSPKTRITFYKEFNQTVLTIDGLVVTIVGGFLIAAGPKHFLIIYGFVILIASTISVFLGKGGIM